MRVLVIETQPTVPLGSLAAPLLDAGLELACWRTAENPPPPSIDEFAGIIALGGAANPDEDERYPWLAQERQLLDAALRRRLPTIGLCLGAELLAQVLGVSVERLPRPEIGWFEVEPVAADPLSIELPRRFHAFQWHSYGFPLPPGATLIAGTAHMAQAFSWRNHAWGLQFHLEADQVIIAGWLGHYSDLLRAQGLDREALTAETQRRAGAYVQQARAVAAAFARLLNRSNMTASTAR